MAPRPSRIKSIYVEVDGVEVPLLDRMMQMCSVTSHANLLRIALWSLGDHLEVEMPNGCFDLRLREGTGRIARKKCPRVRQGYARPKRPSDTHPWRATPFLTDKPVAQTSQNGKMEETT